MFRLLSAVATAVTALAFMVIPFVTVAFMIPGVAHAEKRVALVIGNGAYANASHLSNPASDAADLAMVLRQIGFDVVDGVDLDKRGMEAKLLEFSDRLQNADIALFFYAGHGLQMAGRNYLIPVDARLESPARLSFETFDLRQVQDLMETQKRVNVLILDACRNNPFAQTIAGAAWDSRRGVVGRGLGPAEAAAGTLIAYATQPDNVALDGVGQRNSPFTTALLRHVVTPGLEIRAMLTRVRADVVAATRDQQVPWDHSSLLRDDVTLVPKSGSQFSPPPPPPPPLSLQLPPPPQQLPQSQQLPRLQQPPQPPQLPSLQPPPSPDSVNAVRAFYAALSEADGLAAAALMVPEKRGRGNFNPTEMTTFWSSLRQRLAVQRIDTLGEDKVAVRYNFIGPAGKVCDTTAIVTTVRRGGRTLIQSIAASC
jgi:hypothetical protein